MDNFTIFAFITVAVWMSAVIKITFDQLKLFRVYKEKIDSNFPAEPSDANISNTFSLTKWRLRVIFSKHPDNQDVDRLAKRVRLDLFAMVCLFIALFVSFAIVG